MPLDTGNSIPTEQTKPQLVALLRARFRNYRAANRAQAAFVISSIAIPVSSVLLAPTFPELKPYLALAALVLLLLDVALVDPRQKEWTKRAAKLQEEFDTKVFDLPWNRFVAGTMVDHEDVSAASAKPLSRTRESKFLEWYEPCVGELPLALGRLVCQRTNIVYDSRLRRRYGNCLLFGTAALFVVLLFAGVHLKLNFSDLILTVFVPSTPVFNWALREHRKQIDTSTALLTLKSEVEKLWASALSGANAAELDKGSRELQDAIYQHRAKAPLIFSWVYDRLRTTNEREANHAAEKLVAAANAALRTESAA